MGPLDLPLVCLVVFLLSYRKLGGRGHSCQQWVRILYNPLLSASSTASRRTLAGAVLYHAQPSPVFPPLTHEMRNYHRRFPLGMARVETLEVRSADRERKHAQMRSKVIKSIIV